MRKAALRAGPLLLLATACGRDLSLDSRETLTADAIMQSYQINLYATDSGVTSYSAQASFTADGQPAALPDGDQITLNGTAMTAVPSIPGVYLANGSGQPPAFAFAWTDGGTTYKNSLTATAYPPATAPTAVSKSAANAVAVSGVPSGVSVSATVNAQDKVSGPYFAIPVDVSGGGTAAVIANANLSTLDSGVGVLVLLETVRGALTDATAAGGQSSATVQFGYNVTISD